ncbi:MAG: hypothetical protein O2954_21040 [bacterium]|nr:hypothetical protein [bacterium]
MNGLIFRSLFRFQVKADSLARAGGGAGVTDLIVTSAQVHLVQRSILKRGVGELTVHRPDAVWTESTIFADTLTFVEVAFPFSPIAGATTTTVLDTTILVDLPGDYVQAALVANPQLADVEFLLAPGGSEEFITGMITRNGATPGTEQYPVMTLNYTVKGTSYTDSIRIWEDTFYGGGYNGGPGPGQLLLSSGIRYGALFRFAFPDSIPKGATVAGAELQLTANPEKSVFVGFPFGVDRVEVAVTAGDTTFTRFNTWLAAESSGSFLLNQSLVQGWVSGAVPNLGLALRPRNDAVINWLLLDPPRLKLTYSIPPPLENSGSAP